ncbi:protoporphyrinogen oxidase [Nosocomiicoccus sp. HMSC09A07]|uniref:protoporphyrinogen oxidase n=1 Tax=Nosocomiicoccus sp. HMSC09A07 TaxID=1581145 RepID=UPI0008A101F4|nr:protoporphyrinogen oxidase [Nosocomiicoccus sp. HMSC09A07]OFS64599.1 protoporphyrinogen oxidase [Nosocomiicoccus sp. HMSC09A07]
MKKVCIVGGGVTGLSTAYYLTKNGIAVDLYEASERIGGKIKTYRKNGFVIEQGAESYISRKPDLTDLAVEIGMKDDLVRNLTGRSFIYANGSLSPVPQNTILGVPTTKEAIQDTELLSVRGKARALLDNQIPVVEMHGDISAGEFFKKRLGEEVATNMIEPLLGGVYSTALDEMSLMATYPFFKEEEERYGSLIKGMYERKKRSQNTGVKAPVDKKQGMFYQFKNGLESFIDRLKEVIESQGGHIYLNTPVEKIEKHDDHYEVTVSNSKKEYSDVVVATMHFAYKDLIDEPMLEYFKHMKATTVANIVLCFDESQVDNALDGTGFVINRQEDDMAMTACTWTNKKWAHSAPEGKALLRAYIGKPNNETLNDLIKNGTDEEIVEAVRRDLDKMMNITGEPEFHIITRMPDAAPNYLVGHKEMIDKIHAYLKENYKGLYLIGASHYAVGLPDCVKAAKNTAYEIVD